jgi:hypothetical protein
MKRKDLIAMLDEIGVGEDDDILFVAKDDYQNIEVIEDEKITVNTRLVSGHPQISLGLDNHRLVRRG